MRIRPALRLLALLVLGIASSAPSAAQEPPQSPYALALSHMLTEHLADKEVAIVFDRFPRIDLALEIAQSRGLRAAPHHELVDCEGEGRGRQCRFAVDVEIVLALVHEERSPGEIRLTFFMGEEIPGRISGGHRILTLNRSEGGWVIVSDQPGIRT